MSPLFEITDTYRAQLKCLFEGGEADYSALTKPTNPLEAAILLVGTREKAVSSKELNTLYKEFCYNREFSYLAVSHPSADKELQGLKEIQIGMPGSIELNTLKAYVKDKYHQLSGSPDPQKPNRYYESCLDIDPLVSLSTPEVIKIDMWLEIGKPNQQVYFTEFTRIDRKTRQKLIQSNTQVRKAMAQRTDLTDDEIAILVKDKMPSVRAVIACHSNLTNSQLQQLASDKDDKVSEAARSHPNFKADNQSAINKLPITDIRSRLANPGTSNELLAPLLQSEHDWVKAILALHMNVTAPMLDQLLTESKTVKCYAALSSKLTEGQMQQISEDELAIQKILAQNPNTTEKIQLKLVEIDDVYLRISLANHTQFASVWNRLLQIAKEKNISETDRTANRFYYLFVYLSDVETKSLSKYMFAQPGFTCKYGNEFYQYRLLARHPNITNGMAKMLILYAPDDIALNAGLAIKLLENPNEQEPISPPDWQLKEKIENEQAGYMIQYYAQRPDENNLATRLCASTHRLTLLNKLTFAMFDDIHTKKRLLGQNDLDSVVLAWLAYDSSASIRELTAQHKMCPNTLLQVLACDKSAKVKSAALSNRNFKTPNTQNRAEKPEAVKYHNKGKKTDRIRMAKNSTAPEILADLALDRQVEVRENIARNDHTPDDTLKLLASDQEERVAKALVSRFRDSESEILDLMFEAGGWPRAKVAEEKLLNLSYDHGKESIELTNYVKPLLALNDVKIDRSIAHYCRDPEVVEVLKKSEDGQVLEVLYRADLLSEELIRSKLPFVNERMLQQMLYNKSWSSETIDALLKLDLNSELLDQLYQQKNLTLEQAMLKLNFSRVHNVMKYSTIDLAELANAILESELKDKRSILITLGSKNEDLARTILKSAEGPLKVALQEYLG